MRRADLRRALRVAEAWLLLAATGFALRAGGFDRLRRYGRRVADGAAEPRDGSAIGEVQAALDVAGVALPGRCRACLSRALAGQVMLARRGVAARLRIGVAPRDGSLAAHAWLESGAYLLDSPETGTFAPLPLPDGGSAADR